MDSSRGILVVWSSRTGNLRRFIQRLGYPHVYRIGQGEPAPQEPFLLLTYTASFGEVPTEVVEFLSHNSHNLAYVVGSGNRNWGQNFCRAACEIAKVHEVPLLQTFELSGNQWDRQIFLENLKRINAEKSFNGSL